MKIFVEWSKDKEMRGISLEAKLSDSVRFLKQQIKSKVKIPTARQCLVFAGRQLEDDRTLADLVVHGAVVSGSLVIIQGSQAAVAADINGRAGTCISIDERNGRCKVEVDADGEKPKRQVDVSLAHLKVCGGSVHHPLFLFEDFEAHDDANTHDVKVLIGPTKLMKNGNHTFDESTSSVKSRPKSRVFSLQVECGTFTIWYSKTPQEVVSFFSGMKPSNFATDLHHTMPFLGVIDLRFASMFYDESDPCYSWDPPAFPLTIDLRASPQLPNAKLSAKYFYCIKNFDVLRVFFPSQQVRHFWIEKLQSCGVLLGRALISMFQNSIRRCHSFSQGTVPAIRTSQELVKST